MEVSGQLHAPDTLSPAKVPGTHWIGCWVGLRTGLDAVAKRKKSHHCPYWELNPGHSACSLVSILTEHVTKINSEKLVFQFPT